MRHIPRSLLPSTALVETPDTASKRGGAFNAPVAIEHVRYESSASVRRTDYQLRDGTTGTLYVDAVGSVGGFDIPETSRVQVDGGEWRSVNACHRYDERDGRAHHWEVELR